MRTRVDITLGALRARLEDELGVAMVMALLITSSLAISTVAIAGYMVSNESLAGRDRDSQRAFNVAESGINNALSVLSQQDSSGSQAVGSTLASTGFTLDGGSGTYSAAKTGALTWTVTAYGTSPNGDVTRHLEVQVAAQTVAAERPRPPPTAGDSSWRARPRTARSYRERGTTSGTRR